MRNKKGNNNTFGIILICLVGLIVFALIDRGYIDLNKFNKDNQTNIIQGDFQGDSIKIANWNLQIFGDSKVDLIDTYVNKIKNYDIIFIQEIRDEDGSSFNQLCYALPEYDCKVSSRAGRSSSKEQYGVIYKKNIQVVTLEDYNLDSLDRWERPPVRVLFNVSGLLINIYNIHTKPDDVQKELSYLQDIIPNIDNQMILGDLNADCDYYNPTLNTEFDDWYWIIKDTQDTTVSNTDCAYDRIILNQLMNNQYVSYGIDTERITKDVSDHYLVWIEIAI